MARQKKVLLTAGYGPNELAWGEDMYDLLNCRLARGHELFRMDSHCHYFGLYLIAENINHPATVLENLHWDEFDAELDNDYDVIGIQLKSVYTDKVARMVARIRDKCPNTQIVIGGYGVSTLDTPVPGDTKGSAAFIRENAHHLCREEGVGFMRRLLDDQPVDREITQYHLPTTGFSVAGLSFVHMRVPVILVALGCPNACDFCNTSAFFRHKKIYVAEPEQVYRYMKNYQKRLSTNNIRIILFDEDLFMKADYVRELGRLLRSDKQTWGIRWITFGSMRSMSQFTPEELRECGLGMVWIGVESFLSDAGTTEDHYAKRKGKELKTMFDELHSHGIETTGSLVLGFDFHDRENLKNDIDMFVDMKPTFYQISPLTPCPGTRLYDRMMEEGRIRDTYQWGDFHLWKDDVFKLKNFEYGEIKEYFDYAHEQLATVNGPPPLQMMEVALDGHATFKDSSSEFLRYQADQDRMMAMGFVPFLRACQRYAPSETVKERAAQLEKRCRAELGRAPLPVNLVSCLVSNRIRRMQNRPRQPVVSDPPPRWTYYRRENGSLQILVRKGRKASNPLPYRDHRFVRLHLTGAKA
jgi:haloalkane dehalogenase